MGGEHLSMAERMIQDTAVAHRLPVTPDTFRLHTGHTTMFLRKRTGLSWHELKVYSGVSKESVRSPLSADEAWLAGMLVTDGSVDSFGTPKLGQKIASISTMELLASSFSRPLWTGLACWVSFPFLPASWTNSIPLISDVDLLRHYWRGAVDGDGYIAPGGKRVVFYWRNEQRFLGEAFSSYVEVLGFKGSECTFGRSVSGLTITRRAPELARFLYEDAGLALERKRNRALGGSNDEC